MSNVYYLHVHIDDTGGLDDEVICDIDYCHPVLLGTDEKSLPPDVRDQLLQWCSGYSKEVRYRRLAPHVERFSWSKTSTDITAHFKLAFGEYANGAKL